MCIFGLHLSGAWALGGTDAWPRLFQNRRSSQKTDLEKEPLKHVARNWLGHSPKIAPTADLTVTEGGLQAAVENRGTDGHEKSRESQETLENTAFLESVDIFKNVQVAGTGLEPATSRL